MRGQGSKYSAQERLLWKGWRLLNTSPLLYRVFGFFATRFRGADPEHRPLGAEPQRTETGGPFAA